MASQEETATRKVLVVHECTEEAYRMAGYLKRKGHAVDVCTCTSGAAYRANLDRPDVIVYVMDGNHQCAELLGQLRGQQPDATIIVHSSGDTLKQYRSAISQTGAIPVAASRRDE